MTKRALYIGGVILLIIVAGGIGVYFIVKKPAPTPVAAPPTEAIPAPQAMEEVDTTGWKEYSNQFFSIRVPPSWTMNNLLTDEEYNLAYDFSLARGVNVTIGVLTREQVEKYEKKISEGGGDNFFLAYKNFSQWQKDYEFLKNAKAGDNCEILNTYADSCALKLINSQRFILRNIFWSPGGTINLMYTKLQCNALIDGIITFEPPQPDLRESVIDFQKRIDNNNLPIEFSHLARARDELISSLSTIQCRETIETYNFSKPFGYYDDTNQFYGTLQISGYLSIEKTSCGWEENCFVNQAWFIMTEISNNFSKFFTSPVGMGGSENAFVRKDAISLGCYDEVKNQIKAITDIRLTPISGRETEYTITNEQLKKLLSSDKDHPVTLEAIKYFSDGRAAPDCFSWFTASKVY